jgi:hypothetical protein
MESKIKVLLIYRERTRGIESDWKDEGLTYQIFDSKEEMDRTIKIWKSDPYSDMIVKKIIEGTEEKLNDKIEMLQLIEELKD